MTRKAVLVAVMLVIAGACSGEEADGTVQITGTDFAFNGVPETVAPGTEFTFTNESTIEAHEIVVLKVAEGEERSLEELLALTEEESESVVEFQGVLVALPEEDGSNPEGEGNSITVTEPGRYAMVCFIPQGADPAVLEAAMTGDAEGPPPDMGDGMPHAMLGMAAEFTVEG